MTLEEFLIDKWNSCVWMIHDDNPGNIVMIYDPVFIRQKKLNSLFEEEELIFNKTPESIILFYQDYKNGYLDINYEEIWSVLSNKYGLNYDDIKSLTKNVLLEGDKLKQLTTFMLGISVLMLLLEGDKLKQLIL